MPITVITRSTASPDAAELLEEAFQQLELASRDEDGCTAYEVFQACGGSRADAGFVTFETYTDTEAYEAHQRTDHVLSLGARIGPVLTDTSAYVLPAGQDIEPVSGQVAHG